MVPAILGLFVLYFCAYLGAIGAGEPLSAESFTFSDALKNSGPPQMTLAKNLHTMAMVALSTERTNRFMQPINHQAAILQNVKEIIQSNESSNVLNLVNAPNLVDAIPSVAEPTNQLLGLKRGPALSFLEPSPTVISRHNYQQSSQNSFLPNAPNFANTESRPNLVTQPNFASALLNMAGRQQKDDLHPKSINARLDMGPDYMPNLDAHHTKFGDFITQDDFEADYFEEQRMFEEEAKSKSYQFGGNAKFDENAKFGTDLDTFSERFDNMDSSDFGTGRPPRDQIISPKMGLLSNEESIHANYFLGSQSGGRPNANFAQLVTYKPQQKGDFGYAQLINHNMHHGSAAAQTRGYNGYGFDHHTSASGYEEEEEHYEPEHKPHSKGGYEASRKPGPYGYPSPNFKCEYAKETLYVTKTDWTFDKKCFTVFRTKCKQEYDQGKGIGFKKECSEFTVTKCRTEYDTSSETKCWTVFRKECFQVYVTKVEWEYEEKCETTTEEVCSGHGYDKHCEHVPKEHCHQVLYTTRLLDCSIASCFCCCCFCCCCCCCCCCCYYSSFI
jgi:hypothetical protein